MLIALIAVPAVLWAGAVGSLWSRQESLLFKPVPLAPDYQFGLAHTVEETVQVPGATLHALHLRQPAGTPTRGLVFFLHGNADNLAKWFTNPDFWLSTGYDVFMMDYRGFGKSTGHIESEDQLHDDVRRAWAQVVPAYAKQKLVIYGRSLGTGLATQLAAQVPADLLVLVSPYESIERLSGDAYPWVPSLALRYPLRADQWLPKVRSKVFIVHGEQDTLIPIAHAERLMALNPRVQMLRLPGVGHSDVQQSRNYTEALAHQLGSL
ncbi:alpha/beta fold hydrolase [Aquabacterium sp.]|uniref:alpha/beta hydrolase n=1 Tax=Aquabacterium sp. TaxID=1872578 RepID=UPI002488643F|nr:alpha/beta fold hydrolase [Aquabacterium sp.]MDI1259654.1 alpha/beta fold hydrolase [Aquabacterium sp.]